MKTVNVDVGNPVWLSVSFEHVVVLVLVLFLLGFLGVLLRKALVFRMMSMQVMLLALVLFFAASGSYWQSADGQVLVFFVLVYAAIQTAVVFFLAYRTSHQSPIGELQAEIIPAMTQQEGSQEAALDIAQVSHHVTQDAKDVSS